MVLSQYQSDLTVNITVKNKSLPSLPRSFTKNLYYNLNLQRVYELRQNNLVDYLVFMCIFVKVHCLIKKEYFDADTYR